MIDQFYYDNLKLAFNDVDHKEKAAEFLNLYQSNKNEASWSIESWLRDQTLPSPDTVKYNKASIVMSYTMYGHEAPLVVTLSTNKNSTFKED